MSTSIDFSLAEQIIRGPYGVRLELDAREIYSSDPGMGTPRLVLWNHESMTLDCALDNLADIAPESADAERVQAVADWLSDMSDAADAWLTYWTRDALLGPTSRPLPRNFSNQGTNEDGHGFGPGIRPTS